VAGIKDKLVTRDLRRLRIEEWLATYESAFDAKNTPQICALLELSSDKCNQLERALATQQDLQVRFSDVEIVLDGTDGACATYTREDTFVDPTTGKEQSRSTSVKQCFMVVDGKVELVRVGSIPPT
jgi:hypothetical protein